jgi:hypothetical protein
MSTVTMSVALLALCGTLVLCAGLLLGAAWTIQALEPRLREQAKERRRLNEGWMALSAARRRGQCPRCLHAHPDHYVLSDALHND